MCSFFQVTDAAFGHAWNLSSYLSSSGTSLEIVLVTTLAHMSLSPDGKLPVIVGDYPDGLLVDSHTGRH
ncbi:hypothetical protein AAC387_Pa07g1376 [Persea americana]